MSEPSPPPIPDDVRRFILSSVPSVPYLEAALLFHRDPGKARSISEVATALYVHEQLAGQLLHALRAAGVVSESASRQFVYAPATPVIAEAFDRLAQAYFSNLIGVTNLIHDGTQKNAARFAEAFKLRKDS